MLNNDGDYVIYYVQHLRDDDWVGSNLGAFLDKAQETDLKEYRKLAHEYNANGKCWQTTGWNGSFDPDVAFKLMHFVAGFNPLKKFRVVQIRVSQETSVFCTVEYNMENWKLRKTPDEFG